MRVIRESAIEAYLVRKVKEAGGIAMKLTSPARRNVPDRIVLLPGAFALFVEVKAPGKAPTPAQVREHGRLIRMGMRVYVIDSMQGVDDFMDRAPL